MFNALLQAAVDTVTVVKDPSAFSWTGLLGAVVSAVVVAVLAYLGGKRGANAALRGR